MQERCCNWSRTFKNAGVKGIIWWRSWRGGGSLKQL
jgi:hypothetical protein